MQSKKELSKERKSGLELLRIIMMLQIIFLHACDKGGYDIIANQLSGIHLDIHWGVWLLCRCPVYVYFMLTGYFLVKKNMNFNEIKNKIKSIYIPMIFYSLAIPAIGLLLNLWNLNDINIPKVLTPFLSKTWYFLSAYIILIILSPFLNKLINKLTKKEYKYLLLILLFIFCIWVPISKLPFFEKFISTSLIIANQAGKSLYDYIFMYLLGGYLSLHIKNNKEEKAKIKYLIYFLICTLCQCILVVSVEGYSSIAGYNDNLFVVLQCICLIMFFRDLNFKSKIINYLASFTLTTYIIHEHFILKYYMWENIFNMHHLEFYKGFYQIKILGICILIFACTIIIELLRRLLFKGINLLYLKIKNNIKKETA